MMHRSAFVGLVLAGAASVVLAACATAPQGPGQHPVYPPSEVSGTAAKCEVICDVQVSAPRAEDFCAAFIAKTKDRFDKSPTCTTTILGLPTRDEAAVRDAMVVDVVTDRERYSLLALRTAVGWELAAELGVVKGAAVEKPDAVRITGARAVDAPPLAPYAVEVKVRFDAQGSTVDKVFVCGKQGDTTSCPRAIVTAG